VNDAEAVIPHPETETRFVVPGVVWSMLAGYTLLPGSDDLHLIGWRAALTYLPLAMIAAVALAAIAAVGLREMRRIARLVILIPLATALVGPFAVRVILPGGLNPRYFAAGLPGFLLFIASGMTTGARMRSGRLAIVVLALTMLLGVARHVADPGFPREDIIGASEWLDANVSNDEEMLVSSDEMAYLARFHWPQRRLTVYPPPGVVVSDDNADAVVSQLPSVGTQRVIYIFGRAWLSDPIGALQRTLRERYRSCGEATLRGIRILCLERSGSSGERRAVTGANADMAAAPNAVERHP